MRLEFNSPFSEESKSEKIINNSSEKKEKQELIERLKTLIRSISGKKNLEVTTEVDPLTFIQMAQQGQDANKQWFKQTKINPKTKEKEAEIVHIPEDITESENAAKGKAAHEASHVAITRDGEFKPDEIIQDLGFSSLLASTEERATDENVRQRYTGAGKWLDQARQESAEETSYLVKSNKLGYIPKFGQLCDLIVYAPQIEKVPGYYSPEVLDIYKEIEDEVKKIETTLPNEEATEEQILAKAKERYNIACTKIWPKIKKLAEKDVANEKIREMVEKNQNEKNSDNPLDKLPEKLKDELMKAIKEAMAEQKDAKEKNKEKLKESFKKDQTSEDQTKTESDKEQNEDKTEEIEKIEEPEDKKPQPDTEQQPETNQNDKETEQTQSDETDKEEEITEDSEPQTQEQQENEVSQDTEETEQDQAEDALNDEEAPKDAEEKKQEEQKGKTEANKTDTKENEEQDKKTEPENSAPIDIDKLSKELQKKLIKIFDKLPEEQKKELEKSAKEKLEKLEDEVHKETSSKLNDKQRETHEEYKKRKDEEREAEANKLTAEERALERKMIEKEMALSEEKLASIENDKDYYDKTYEEIREIDEKLYRRLEAIFNPNIKQKVKLKSDGYKLNLPAIFKWEAGKDMGAKNIENKIFESTTLPDKKDYAFTILVDLSGSMRDDGKIEETFKGVVLLAEVLNRLGIKNEIMGYQDEAIRFKKFTDDLNDDIRHAIAGMRDEPYGTNPGGHNWTRNTDDGPSLAEASKSLEKQPSKEKFLLVLSDGQPNGRYSTEDDLIETVRNILHNTNQKLIGIGLGPDTEHVKDYYPASLPDININQLPEVFGQLLEDIVLNPEKYKAGADSKM